MIRHSSLSLLILPFAISANYHSQYQQDRYVNEHFFHDKKDGIFVDIGAHDGVTYSNSFFYEKTLGWQGLCIEPMPEVYAQLIANRSCLCIQGCITNITGERESLRVTSPHVDTEMLSGLLDKYDPRHLQRVDRELAVYGGTKEIIPVMCYTLNDLVAAYAIDHIDYLSIDTEGGEYDILMSIDFEKLHVHVVDVENNFPNDTRIRMFMESKGFRFVARVHCDEIYENTVPRISNEVQQESLSLNE